MIIKKDIYPLIIMIFDNSRMDMFTLVMDFFAYCV